MGTWPLRDITLSACESRTADCLQYIVDQGTPLHPRCGQTAARCSCVETLRFLHARGVTWDAKDCANVAAYDKLENLRFLHEIGTPWDARTCSEAVKYKRVACLEYARAQGCPEEETTVEVSV